MLLIINAVVMSIMFTVWRKSGLLNMTIKVGFLLLALANGFQAMQAYGFVVRA